MTPFDNRLLWRQRQYYLFIFGIIVIALLSKEIVRCEWSIHQHNMDKDAILLHPAKYEHEIPSSDDYSICRSSAILSVLNLHTNGDTLPMTGDYYVKKCSDNSGCFWTRSFGEYDRKIFGCRSDIGAIVRYNLTLSNTKGIFSEFGRNWFRLRICSLVGKGFYTEGKEKTAAQKQFCVYDKDVNSVFCCCPKECDHQIESWENRALEKKQNNKHGGR